MHVLSGRPYQAPRRSTLTVVGISMAMLLTACSGGKDDKKAPGQAVAKVNKSELTVHQINYVLAQQRGLKPEQADAASRQILDRLIDQELALQKAAEQKLDRDARVVAQLEASRREIISRAYLERVGEGASKPTPDAVKKYYDANPALFADRRVYQLQEINIEAAPDKVGALSEVLKRAKSINDYVEFLKANGFKYSGNQVVRGAEQLPLNLLPTLAKMNPGQSVFNQTPAGGSVLVLLNARPQPVSEKQAQQAIEQFLFNDQKRKLVAQDLKSLRGSAEITYLGKFADMAKNSVGAAPAAAQSPAEVAASAVGSAPGLQGGANAPATPGSSGALDNSTISKGLGLK
jgi:EpsD family peptidyl-prolyl cis-trans isomerase